MEWKISRNFTFDKETCSANCQTRSIISGRNKVGLYMKITKISDVLKGTDVLEGTINGGGGGRVDLPCSSFAVVFNSDLAQKRKTH